MRGGVLAGGACNHAGRRLSSGWCGACFLLALCYLWVWVAPRGRGRLCHSTASTVGGPLPQTSQRLAPGSPFLTTASKLALRVLDTLPVVRAAQRDFDDGKVTVEPGKRFVAEHEAAMLIWSGGRSSRRSRRTTSCTTHHQAAQGEEGGDRGRGGGALKTTPRTRPSPPTTARLSRPSSAPRRGGGGGGGGGLRRGKRNLGRKHCPY